MPTRVLGWRWHRPGKSPASARPHNAFLKALLSSHFKWPNRKRLLVSHITEDYARELRSMTGQGFKVWATDDSASVCERHGVKATVLTMPQAIEAAANCEVDFVVNFPEHPSKESPDYYKLRRTATDYALPVISNERVAIMLAQSLCKHKSISELDVQPYDYYHSLY